MRKLLFGISLLTLLTGCCITDKSTVTLESEIATPISTAAWTNEVRTVDFINEKVTEEVIEDIHTTTYRVTAYCSCEQCCGKWASNRPLDSNGLPIVYGASGDVLIEEVSCASPLPFNTEIDLLGHGTVVVHDRTADWIVEKHGGNIIDLYFSDHQKALEWGVRYMEGVIK